MKKLLKKIRQYYERELSIMQQVNAEFAAEFPAQAGRLGMQGGQNMDPHIERFIQATALSNARTAKLIDDNDHKLTEALLQVNYPHYVQPFPSSAIVHCEAPGGGVAMTAPVTVARGAGVVTRSPEGPRCRFRTAYEVPLTPVEITKVAFSRQFTAPQPLSVPQREGAGSVMSIDIECKAPAFNLAQVELKQLRVFIDAEPSLCATTRDVLFMNARVAWLETDGAWLPLKDVPIMPVGFAPHEALLPRSPLSLPAYLLLTEYFVYPEKFNFFNIDWTAIKPLIASGCRRVTLHLGIAGVSADSHIAHSLGQLSKVNFVLSCTPAVNLFRHAACPIELTHTAPDYELIVDAGPAEAYDIYSIDRVTTVQKARHRQALTEFRPYYSLRHGEAGGRAGRYYVVRRDAMTALTDPGHETRIALVNLDLDPVAATNASVSIELTCTNRDLPSRLACNDAAGTVQLEDGAGGLLVRLLRRPTSQWHFNTEDHWRLIAHLSLSHCALTPEGLDLLKETLSLYDLPQSAVSQRQIAGIVGLEHRQATSWMRDDGHHSLVHGLAVRITLDEDAFAGAGVHLFVSVLDHFFALYVHCQSFTQLTAFSQASGKELLRCPARSGAIPLV